MTGKSGMFAWRLTGRVVPLLLSTMCPAGLQADASGAVAPVVAAQEAGVGALQPTPQQRAGMLKQWMQLSQHQIRAYEWIETTVVTIKGEEKSRQRRRCYYALDGTLQKVAADAAPVQPGGATGPLRRRAAEHKKAELTAYMQSAVALIHSYVPPDPAAMQASVQAGHLSMRMLEPGQRASLDFTDFRKPGDRLGVEVELPTNRLLGVAVSSYLDTAKDAILLNASMDVLPDGTIHTRRSMLEAPAEHLAVTVENGDYRRVVP